MITQPGYDPDKLHFFWNFASPPFPVPQPGYSAGEGGGGSYGRVLISTICCCGPNPPVIALCKAAFELDVISLAMVAVVPVPGSVPENWYDITVKFFPPVISVNFFPPVIALTKAAFERAVSPPAITTVARGAVEFAASAVAALDFTIGCTPTWLK
jgi:hypothetical protein